MAFFVNFCEPSHVGNLVTLQIIDLSKQKQKGLFCRKTLVSKKNFVKMTVRHRENVNKEDTNGKPKDNGNGKPFRGRFNPK